MCYGSRWCAIRQSAGRGVKRFRTLPMFALGTMTLLVWNIGMNRPVEQAPTSMLDVAAVGMCGVVASLCWGFGRQLVRKIRDSYT